jgi:hypothetical protein
MLHGKKITDIHEIQRQRPDDSCYQFTIQNTLTGSKSKAYLTYELHPTRSFERSLLLCDDRSLLRSPEDRARFSELAKELQAIHSQQVALTKSVVNRLVAGDLQLSGVRVAVHKFGPVPVVAIGAPFEVPIHGRFVKAQLALFPNVGPRGSPDKIMSPNLMKVLSRAPSFISSREEFVQSMTVAPHLVFQRYLEDVAEDFHDLRRTLRQEHFYRRAKQAETRLSESIGSKLRCLIPKPVPYAARTPWNQAGFAYFEEHAGTLYEAAIARAFAMMLLNEVYPSAGILSLSQHYRDEIRRCHEMFHSYLGAAMVFELKRNSTVLQFLEECHNRYDERDLFNLKKARILSEFATFLGKLWFCSEDWGKIASNGRPRNFGSITIVARNDEKSGFFDVFGQAPLHQTIGLGANSELFW